ncbi:MULTISPECIES: S1C family serine protease [unclassified Caballeronia]|uniref:S1C family serine protease n=1 Tax=unclassified Caballeronia TaxID=2646786 RepID=UPI002854CD1F|nr:MULTISPECIES: S1C family serine protease [unclassified Caballeronia]MDR5752665.1 S1C family serine protease [Caballeronia sp. LZ024]MDR5841307.1 S1C family serine protease [Caballeronia sp. LZ031]
MQSTSSDASPLVQFSEGLAQIVEQVGQGVVAVHGRRRIASSGVVWREGVVVTAAHTLRRDEGIDVTLNDGRTVGATLAGRDAGTDIAVLRLDGIDLTPPAAGDARSLKAGHFVLAVARGDDAATHADSGVIGSVGRPWRTWRGGQLDAFVRLDGGLHPGFSGAALADMRGEVVGICTSALARGVGMLIPRATIDRVAEELLTRGRVARPYLGVGTQPVSLSESWVTKMQLASNRGLLVNSLAPDGPAERAGILIGDVLVEMAGNPCGDFDELHAALASAAIGQPMKVALIRGGERVECAITFGERPQRNGCR